LRLVSYNGGRIGLVKGTDVFDESKIIGVGQGDWPSVEMNRQHANTRNLIVGMREMIATGTPAGVGTMTYIVHLGIGTECAIIDSVLDYDPKSGRTKTTSAEKVVDYVNEHQLQVEWILETHAHADHLSAAAYLKKHLGGKTAIGEKISQVQKVFKGIFNLESEFKQDGSQFDQLLASDEVFNVGKMTGKVLFVPGHTPACVAYQFGD
jgi:glyoxylase-like metal-dependent hydrolase (beta-lactamase superfamily II)